jgi:prefoldin alpha subunit
MSDAQVTTEQLSYELAVYREQVAMIKRETERVSLTTIDLTNALKTVESLQSGDALVPIGGGALIKSNVSQTKVLVPIGAEYLLEIDKEAAGEEMKKRIEATKKAVEKLNVEFNRIAGKLREVSGQLQKLEMQSQISQRVDSNIHEDYI